MKKRLLAVLTAVVMVSSFAGTTVLAEESFNENDYCTNQEENLDDSITTVDLNELVMYRRLADGTRVLVKSPRIDMTQHTIEAGETMEYYTADGYYFSLIKDMRVNFQAKFNKIISYECGFANDENTVEMKNTTGLSFNVIKVIPESGDYYFYITNNSDGPVTVKSGKVTF